MTTEIRPVEFPDFVRDNVSDDKLQKVSQLLQEVQLAHQSLNQFKWYRKNAETMKSEFAKLKNQATQGIVNTVKNVTGLDLGDAADRLAQGDFEGARNSFTGAVAKKFGGIDPTRLLSGDTSQLKGALADKLAEIVPGLDKTKVANGDYSGIGQDVLQKAKTAVEQKTGINVDKALAGDVSQIREQVAGEVAKRAGIDPDMLKSGNYADIRKGLFNKVLDEMSDRFGNGINVRQLANGNMDSVVDLGKQMMTEKLGFSDQAGLQNKVNAKVREIAGNDTPFSQQPEDIKNRVLSAVSGDSGINVQDVLNGDTSSLTNYANKLVGDKIGIDPSKILDPTAYQKMAGDLVTSKTNGLLDGNKLITKDFSDFKNLLPTREPTANTTSSTATTATTATTQNTPDTQSTANTTSPASTTSPANTTSPPAKPEPSGASGFSSPEEIASYVDGSFRANRSFPGMGRLSSMLNRSKTTSGQTSRININGDDGEEGPDIPVQTSIRTAPNESLHPADGPSKYGTNSKPGYTLLADLLNNKKSTAAQPKDQEMVDMAGQKARSNINNNDDEEGPDVPPVQAPTRPAPAQITSPSTNPEETPQRSSFESGANLLSGAANVVDLADAIKSKNVQGESIDGAMLGSSVATTALEQSASQTAKVAAGVLGESTAVAGAALGAFSLEQGIVHHNTGETAQAGTTLALTGISRGARATATASNQAATQASNQAETQASNQVTEQATTEAGVQAETQATTAAGATAGETAGESVGETVGETVGENLAKKEAVDAASTAALDGTGIGEIIDVGLTLGNIITTFVDLFNTHHGQTVTEGGQVGL